MLAQPDTKYVLLPTDQPRAVIYGRVSGDDSDNDGRNLAGQMEMGRDYCAKHGYFVVAELAEDVKGASGAEIDLPRLNQVRDLAQARRFDVLVVRELDRLSRSLGKQLVVEEELKRNGVRIEYELYDYPATPEGNLMKNVRASFAEYERDKITERTVRARRLKVKSGSVLCYGRAPYGYRVEKRDQAYALVIYELEAAIVRLIFRWWIADRLAVSEIVRRLAAMGAPLHERPMRRRPKPGQAPSERHWTATTVRKLLGTETYAGTWHFGKHDKYGHRRPREEWVGAVVPAIVSRDDFDLAQALLADSQRRHGHKAHYEHLMARRVTCAICNRPMTADIVKGHYKGKLTVFRYYSCRHLKGQGKGAGHHVNATRVDAAVWEWVKGLLLDPKRLRAGMAAYAQQQEKGAAPIRQQLETARSLLEQKRREYAELLDLYLSSHLRREVLDTKSQAVDREIRSLEQTAAELAARLDAATLTEDRMEGVERFAAAVREHLSYGDDDFDKRRWLIHVMNVTGTWRIADGQPVLDVQCIVADHVLRISGTCTSGCAVPKVRHSCMRSGTCRSASSRWSSVGAMKQKNQACRVSSTNKSGPGRGTLAPIS